MQVRFAALWLGLAAVCCAACGCGADADDVTLQGSGATFPAPLYKRWFLDYYGEHRNVRVNYTPIGSGAGIRQFTSGLVMFGASDAGISKGEEEKLPANFGGVYPLPMTAGAVVLSYRLPGIDKPIRLSREAYVKIFLRDITNWNDGAIARANPGVALPDRNIVVVTRADSSGTSYAFSNHMNAVAKAIGVEWAPGVSKSPHWKDAISAQGNDGVAALIQLTPGAIGYLEYGYAELASLPMAELENRSGKFLAPDKEGKAGLKALEGAPIPPDLQIKVPDPANPDAYPIVTYTWMLCRKQYGGAGRDVETLKTVLRYCLEDRQQQTAGQLGYLPLPKDVVEKVRERVEEIKAVP